MKRRFMLPLFLLLLLLSVNVSQVQAETAPQSENVEDLGTKRYDAEYYAKPDMRFPTGQQGTYGAARATLSLEEYIVAALENFQEEIDVSSYNLSRSEASKEYLKIINNNPQLFYVRQLVSVASTSGKAVSLCPYYLDGLQKADVVRMQGEMETAVQRVLEQVDGSMNAVQKALVVHDCLVQNCEYDQERLMAGTVPDISHTAYGALVERIAVCDGYANAYAYIMENKLGIPCTIVSSDPMNHAWNMIEIDGAWYHVDVTWDDPVWDRIGRVGHNYFLLSDQAISQDSPNAATGNGNHYAWTKGYTADDSRYDQQFWAGVQSGICYYNNAWYYSEYQQQRRTVSLMKKEDLFAGSGERVYEIEPWAASGQSFYTLSFMYLCRADDKLYFNTSNAIMQMDEEGTVQSFCEPIDLGGMRIFGFTVRDGEFLYAPYASYTQGKQTDIRKYSMNRIEGITAENVSGVYTGEPYEINVRGIQEGDNVRYALMSTAGIVYNKTQPVMVNAGKYWVSYRVSREGYATFEGMATVTIEKAETECTAPEGCTGKSGGKLKDVALPEGFQWKNSYTKLSKEGEHTYPAVFTPKDAVNFKTVDVDIRVSVSCPGHKYTSKVTKQPTVKEEGIRTYTCQYCEDSYTEKIAKKTNGSSQESGDKKDTEKTAKDISKTASIVIGATTFTYNGKLQTPVASVKSGKSYLVRNRDYTVSYQNNKNVGTATLTVTGIGNYKGKLVKKFTIIPKSTKISGKIRAQKAALAVKWKKQKSIDGYEIWCSTSYSFTRERTVKKTAKKTAVKLTVKKLKPRTGYFVKIRTYKKVKGKKYYSSWSKIQYVRTK